MCKIVERPPKLFCSCVVLFKLKCYSFHIYGNKCINYLKQSLSAEKHAEVPCVTASVDDLHIQHSVR